MNCSPRVWFAAVCLLVSALPAAALASEAPEALQFGHNYQPTAWLRTSWIQGLTSTRRIASGGVTSTLDPRKADPSPFGYRQGFLIENAQIGLKGAFSSGLYYQGNVEFVPREKDGNRSPDYLRDATIGYRYQKWVDVRLGWQKAQYSQANLKGAAQMTLPYAPTFDFLMPQRLMGVSVIGSEPGERVKLAVGAYNSAKQSSEQMRDNDQLLVTARVELAADKFFAKQDDWQWRLGANIASVERHFDPPTQHRWVGIDTHARYKRVSLEAEYTVNDFYQPALGNGSQRADRAWGWHADLSVALPWDLNLTGRMEEMDGDQAERGKNTSLNIEELSRQKKRWITVGLGWRPVSHARCIAAFAKRDELEGYSRHDDVAQLTCDVLF